METNIIRVLKPGLLTTIQDLGRYGYQQFGMVVAGAMDGFALQIANLLVGNNRDEAGIEITMVGPELLFLEDAIIALCGADLSPTLDGHPVPNWTSFHVKSGQILRFGHIRSGARAYLAVSGGLVIPAIMNSKSTYLKAGIGGIAGRALQKGDILRGTKHSFVKKIAGRRLATVEIPTYSSKEEIRVLLGPDQDAFTEEGIETFLSQRYTVSHESDRMGYRLTGPSIRHKDRADILSDAILFGTVQVPASGEPIILMADRQTVGGYARIATVISVDFSLLAQLKPNDQLYFRAVSLREAQELYMKQEGLLKMLSLAF